MSEAVAERMTEQAAKPEPVIDDDYMLNEAERLKVKDPAAAKCYIITARSLFPDKLSVHMTAYDMEKEDQNYEQAAVCFSHICSTFPQMETWEEFIDMINTLQTPESEFTPENEFYMKMFPHITYDIQQKLIVTGLQKTDSILSKSKLLLMTFQRFPQVAIAHSSHLLELLADGAIQNQFKCQELLVEEALPLYFDNPPELPRQLVCRIYTLSLEHCIQKIVKEDTKRDISEYWKKILQILSLCSKINRWDTFPGYRKSLSHKFFWEKLLEFMASSKSDSTQVLFHATTLFIYSLNCYIKSGNIRLDDVDVQHILVEGFSDYVGEQKEGGPLLTPKISYPSTTNEIVTEAFVHAAKCWHILNNEPFHRDFNKLLVTLPLKGWVAHFLFDLSFYIGHYEEAEKLMAEMTNKNTLSFYVQQLSLCVLRNELTVDSFELILKIIGELPIAQGKDIDCFTINEPRHMVFLPLTQKALVQYCAKAIVNALKPKLQLATCSNQLLGDVLILTQMEYPFETAIPEQIFAKIMSRRSFIYRKLLTYLIIPDFIEEFYYIANTQQDNFTLEITLTPTTSTIINPTRIFSPSAIVSPVTFFNSRLNSPEDTTISTTFIAEPESPPLADQGIPVIKRPNSSTQELLQDLQQQSSSLDMFPIQKEQSMEAPLIDQMQQDSSQPLNTLEDTKVSMPAISITATQPESNRRTSRCSEKSESTNYRSIFKQQIARSNENLANIIANFIIQEQESIIQNLFSTPQSTE